MKMETEKLINEIRLDLACGQNKVEGYFGIDIAPGENVDAVVDLESFPWPIESNSAEDIVCNHYVEHTPKDLVVKDLLDAILEAKTLTELKGKVKILKDKPSDGLIRFMEEVYRILKPGGRLRIVSPYYSSIRCWQDPTHSRAISEASFLYYNKGWREQNRLDHYSITCDFDYNYGYAVQPDWLSRSEEAKSFGIKHYNNVVTDIIVTLTKR